MIYIVFIRYDDGACGGKGTADRARTDHYVAPGSTFYGKHGRATVVACREDRAVPTTWGRA